MTTQRATKTTRDNLDAIVAVGLRDCEKQPPDKPLDKATWVQTLSAAKAERLEPALAWAIHDGYWPATSEQADEAFDAHQRAMALALLLERELINFGDRFAQQRIDFRVLKGPAVAYLDEADPSRRAFGDIDLLVKAADLTAVQAIVEQEGGQRRYPEPAPGFDQRFSKGMSFRFDRNFELDVHRTLASGAYGLAINLDALFEHTEAFTVDGFDLVALDRTGRFLHACYHAILGGDRIRIAALRDLVHTVPANAAELQLVLGRARAWRAEAVVASAVTQARQRLAWRAPPVLADWADCFEPSSRERRWMAAYFGPERSYAAQMLVGLEALPGITDRVAYARANARPTKRLGGPPLPTGHRARSGAREHFVRARRGLRAFRQILRP